MRNMMDLSSINIYQLHSVRFLRLMRLHRESELKRRKGKMRKTLRHYQMGPFQKSILYPGSFGIQCALGPDISGLFPTQASKHWQILKKKKRDVSVSKRGYVIFSTGELTPMFPPEGTSWNTKNVEMSDMSTWFMVLFCSPSIESILNPLLSSFQSALSSICC